MKKFSRTNTNIFRSIIVALLIPFTFACTGMSIFIANSTEMPGTIPTLVPVLCGLVGIVALCLFLVQLPFLFVKKHWFPAVNSLLLGCGFLLWLQANVFNWNFGQLDGSGVNWSAFRHLMVLEIGVYVAVIGLVVWKRQLLNQYSIHLACLLIFMQSVPLAKPVARELISMRTKVAARHLLGFKTTPKMYEIAKEEVTPKCPEAEPTLDPSVPAWKQYDITYDGFFDYSPKQNVVLIIPDSFSSALFQRIIKKHPEVSEWFSDFNYFPKQKSDVSTAFSIPQMLTGCDSDPVLGMSDKNPNGYVEKIVSLWNSEGALQKTLTEGGFQTRLYTMCPQFHHWDHHYISNIRLKHATEDQLKDTVNNITETGIGYFIDLATIRSIPIVLKPADIEQFSPISQFLHSRFAEKVKNFMPVRYHIDAFLVRVVSGNPVTVKSPKPVLNVIHYQAAHAPYIFNENFESERMDNIDGEERQAFAALLLLKRLLDDMKAAGTYDNTLVVIAGDHGNNPLRVADITDLSHRYNALLLVKRQGERHHTMVYRTEYTHIKDIPPTILDAVGLTNPPGRFSIFDLPPDVLAQREEEHEAFWARCRKLSELQVIVLEKQENARLDALRTSEIALKRSDLHVKDAQLRWYVGDNYDVWNETLSNNEPMIAVTPTYDNAKSYYSSTARFRKKDSTGWTSFWSNMGIIDTQNLADGDYTVEFLLPIKGGTYASNVLGTVTVVSGTASVVPETPAVAAEAATVR